MSMPQLFHDFPELSSLSREDLEELISDPAFFHATFHSLPAVKALLHAQTELGMANESIAKRNLALQDHVYRLRAETQDAFSEAKALQVRQKEVEREQRELYQRYSPSFLLLRLRHSTTAQDDLSESLASSFVRSQPLQPGDVVDEFIRQFKDLRKTYHKRKIWSEQWAADKVAWRDD
ncbi:hypothetical protein BS47DRAFT_1317503 [Hydnum rufescens UP504]|uniref:VPS37 C-terminal domain-containing protein n=1 Tax=Hydnum rufescens UP504 TaxID=1448309 RepID=A0A9P6AWS0_9AGAM|nr:hypothetical protein BS47DRAFT_1317503 [Hydnum rufescens UP504]